MLAPAQRLKNLEPPWHVKPGDTIVIGFLGGFERWNDETRSVRKLVQRLRQTPGVHVESVANHNWPTALRFIERARAGHPRVIIFGQSLGGDSTVRLARALRSRHIPVELTVQVDSFGLHDGLIPDNVRAAARTGGACDNHWIDDLLIERLNAGIPTLEITRLTNGQIRICWPAPSTGLVLQCTTNLNNPIRWQEVTLPVVIVGGKKCVVINPTNAAAFYHLCQ